MITREKAKENSLRNLRRDWTKVQGKSERAADAGSRFDATIRGSNSDYFLISDFALSTTAGTSRTFVDKPAGKKCGPFVSFGTWTTTLP